MAKHIVTEDDVLMKRFPAEAEVGDEVDVPDELGEGKENSAPKPGDEAKAKLDERMAGYKKHYPKEKMFFLTSDGQVFLSASKLDAINHQKTIDPDKEVQEYKA